MNLPSGVSRVVGKSVKSFDPRKDLDDLAAANFTGYTVETLFGEHGIEESALLFRQGQGLGAVYEYYGLKQTLNGDDALVHVVNAFQSDLGVMDLVDLSVQQIDLVFAFNPKLKFAKPVVKGQFRALAKDSFDASLGKRLGPAADAGASSKESLFKRFGLVGIEGR